MLSTADDSVRPSRWQPHSVEPTNPGRVSKNRRRKQALLKVSHQNGPFTEHQIIAVLKSVEAGKTEKDACREAAISEASYYKRKAKYGGIEAAHIKKIKDLEDENL